MKMLVISALIVSCCLALPTWESLGPYGGSQRDVAIAPSNENIVYALSKHPDWDYLTSRIHRSTDGGNTWAFRSVVSDSLNAYSLAVDPSDPDIIYVGSKKKIIKSIDGALTWSEYVVTANKDTIPSIKVNPSSPQIVYATGTVKWTAPPIGRCGFFKSIDGGVTWQAETLGTVPGGSEDIAIAASNHDIIYLGGRSGGVCVFKSLDGGETFTNITNNLADSANVLYRVWSVAVHETLPNFAYAGTHKSIWRTTDGGSTWSEALLCSAIVWDIATTADDPSILYAIADSIIYKSTDAGTTWAVTGPGYERAIYYGTLPSHLAVKDNDASDVFASSGGRKGMFRTTNGGTNWDPAIDGIAMHKIYCCDASETDPSLVYMQSHFVGVYKSTDTGATWSMIPDFSSGCLVLTDIVIHNTDPDTIFAFEGEG